MINDSNILGCLECGTAMWCPAGLDSADLAHVVEQVIADNMRAISVVSDSVPIIWPWLENKNIKIFTRFYIDAVSADSVSDLTENVNSVFKQGADGAQIFIRFKDIDAFVSQLYMIRDDLFFNKDLIIGIDICDVGPFDWGHLFSGLKKIRANGVMLALSRDTGDRSDFVGRIYAVLNAWDGEYDGKLQFAVGLNPMRIDQVVRLTRLIQPNLCKNTMFFVS